MIHWLSLAFGFNRRLRRNVVRSPIDASEDVLRLSAAADLALATGILRTLLDKKFIELNEASAVCRFVADTIADVQISHEISDVQVRLWTELSNTFERRQCVSGCESVRVQVP